MSFRRMLPFIFVNIIVSAAVVLAILFWWEQRGEQQVTFVPSTPVPQATVGPAGSDTSLTPTAASETADEQESAGPITYIVQTGDTLGSISAEFDVPLDDIMTINNITDPNILSVGQELVIPVGGIPEPTAVPTEEPAPDVAPTPIPSDISTEGEVDIQLIQLVGAGVLTDEAITIANLGNRSVALLDWKILDPQGREYRFGAITLFGDGSAVILHTSAGADTLADVYWGLDEAIWESGETIILVDAEGTTQASFVVP